MIKYMTKKLLLVHTMLNSIPTFLGLGVIGIATFHGLAIVNRMFVNDDIKLLALCVFVFFLINASRFVPSPVLVIQEEGFEE